MHILWCCRLLQRASTLLTLQRPHCLEQQANMSILSTNFARRSDKLDSILEVCALEAAVPSITMMHQFCAARASSMTNPKRVMCKQPSMTCVSCACSRSQCTPARPSRGWWPRLAPTAAALRSSLPCYRPACRCVVCLAMLAANAVLGRFRAYRRHRMHQHGHAHLQIARFDFSYGSTVRL